MRSLDSNQPKMPHYFINNLKNRFCPCHSIFSLPMLRTTDPPVQNLYHFEIVVFTKALCLGMLGHIYKLLITPPQGVGYSKSCFRTSGDFMLPMVLKWMRKYSIMMSITSPRSARLYLNKCILANVMRDSRCSATSKLASTMKDLPCWITIIGGRNEYEFLPIFFYHRHQVVEHQASAQCCIRGDMTIIFLLLLCTEHCCKAILLVKHHCLGCVICVNNHKSASGLI